jgi:hypothetical protein
MVFPNAGAEAERAAALREAVGDDVQIMVDAEQRSDGGTSISLARAIASYRLGRIGDLKPGQKIDEEAPWRSRAMLGHLSPELNASVVSARGTDPVLQWFSGSPVLMDCPDAPGRLFG